MGEDYWCLSEPVADDADPLYVPSAIPNAAWRRSSAALIAVEAQGGRVAIPPGRVGRENGLRGLENRWEHKWDQLVEGPNNSTYLQPLICAIA